MSDPVPAIAEASATGAVAELFADIRQVLGVEVVNLIWRHLATIPDALPWAWGMLRPLYADGTIAAEAQALHGGLALPRLPPFPPDLLSAIELDGGDVVSIRNILAAYDRTNAMALVALSALLCRLEGQPGTSEPTAELGPEPSPEPPARIPLPPLPGLDTLSESTAGLVLILNRLGTRRDDPVLASMYRHLAYWRAYLALAWALIAPLDADGSLERAIADALAKARARAARLAMRLRAPPLDAATTGAIQKAVEPFAGDVIAKMVVICALLRAATRP
ncbi:MAG TPA: hypothetical protein VNN75_11555 [Stellaceae bacterium]|jgi:hypothetical protein|nr:hypothetical protein [Stellaceae bacterium]